MLDTDETHDDTDTPTEDPSLRSQIASVIRTLERFSAADLATQMGTRNDRDFRLALQGARDDLREEGACEFAPCSDTPGWLERVRGEQLLQRAATFRAGALRKLDRSRNQLLTIDPRDMAEGGRARLDGALQKTGAMVGALAGLRYRRRFEPDPSTCATSTTPRPGAKANG